VLQIWHRLRISLPADEAEGFSSFCFELGSCGLESAKGTEGEQTVLTVFFHGDLNIETLRQQTDAYFRENGPSPGSAVWDHQEELDWTKEWRQHYRPVHVGGRYVVYPPWLPVQTAEGELPIIIDPGMAFGTGGHESTQLCLEALAGHSVHAETCLDVGTGSGILAIAALLKGARSVTAIDIDSKAVENATFNLQFNHQQYRDDADARWAGSFEVLEGDVESVRGRAFDLILANLESHIIYPILESLKALMAETSTTVFSGLLLREEASFESAIRTAGFTPQDRCQLNEWFCCIAVISPAGPNFGGSE
jgi:ribosomal protein L11 methyltransferase